MIPGLPNPWVILGVAVGLLAYSASLYIYAQHREDLGWEVKVAAQSAHAAQILLDAQTKATETERKYNELNVKTEADHAAATAEIDAAYDGNRQLVARLGGMLRDKAGRPGGADNLSAVAAAPGGGTGPAAGCALSVQVSQDLLTLARDADAAAEYGRTCHAWAASIGR